MRLLVAFATSIVQGLLELQSTSSFSSQLAADRHIDSNLFSCPSLELVLTPRWNRDNTTAEAINATLIVGGRRFERGQSLMEMVLENGRVPSMDYTGAEAIRAWDKEGELRLSTETVGITSLRGWSVSRETVGDIRLDFTVYPRSTTKATPPGPRIDWRENGGGLIGTGQVFVPTIAAHVGLSVQPLYNISVRWDLSFSPADTETVWTYGEGQFNWLIASADALVNSVYMVGRQVHKWTTKELPGYGFYWLTEPPRHLLDDPTALAENISKLFPKMANYFEQTGSTYRVFLRESPRGYGGSAFQWSFILEWDHGVRIGRSEDDKTGQEDDLYFLISHEMVHNWPTMEGPADGSEDANSTWYEEGIATYYQAVLPYERGLISTKRFVEQMNQILSAYYTSPAINMSSVECSEKAWTNTHAQRLPYYRSVLFLLHLDHDIRVASKDQATLRQPVNELLQRQRRGESYRFQDFLDIVGQYVDRSATLGTFMDMSAGSWLVPPPALGSTIKAVRRDQRVYDAGYDTETIGNKVIIAKVTPGSNAERAGCRVGDQLTFGEYRYGAMDDYDMNTSMTLRREGREFMVDFWPRGGEPVESWQYVVV